MLSISSLRKIWNEAQGEYHLYNLLFAINETLSNDGRLCEDNIISPDGLDIMLLSASFRKNYMCLFFDIENYSKFKLPFELLVFIFFSVQKVLLPATFRINEKGGGGYYDIFLKIPFQEMETLIKNEQFPLVYIALSGVNKKKKVVWTRTSGYRSELHNDA